jgi:HYR domain
MRRSTRISAFFSLLRAGSAGAVAAATILSCSDSTGPQPLNDHIVAVEDFVPGSLKLADLTLASGTLLAAPVAILGDLLAPPGTALFSTVIGGGYVVSKVPFAPESYPEIIPGDTVYDDGFLPDVDLGFSFNFYGINYSKVNVYSNGFLMFGPGIKDPSGLGFYKGGPIPNAKLPNNIIAFAWTDWQPQLVKDGIRYARRGTAPHRRFILQFNNVPEYSRFGTPKGWLLSQVVLEENTNVITIYTNHMNFTVLGQVVTQGIENADGTKAAWADSVRDSVTQKMNSRVQGVYTLTNDAVQFTPPGPPVVTAPADKTVMTTPPSTGGSSFALVSRVGTCNGVINPGVATATDDGVVKSIVGVRSDDPTLALDAPYPKGVTTITWTATDGDGMTGTATQTITVVDKENPWIAAPANDSADNDPHLPSAVVSVGSAQAADNCTDVKVSSTRSDGATLPLTAPFMVGITTITWTATDGSGNTASATQSIKVRDVEAPSLTVPLNITVDATGPNGAVVNYQLNATDNVAVTSTTCTTVSGATFPIGASSVTCTAADAAGNKSTPGTFEVIVRDAPTEEQNLIKYILGLGMSSGTTNPLVNQLQAAFDSSVGDNHVACVKMNDFVGMVGKKGREILDGPASYITGQAIQIMTVLKCSRTGAHPQLAGPDGSSN